MKKPIITPSRIWWTVFLLYFSWFAIVPMFVNNLNWNVKSKYGRTLTIDHVEGGFIKKTFWYEPSTGKTYYSNSRSDFLHKVEK